MAIEKVFNLWKSLNSIAVREGVSSKALLSKSDIFGIAKNAKLKVVKKISIPKISIPEFEQSNREILMPKQYIRPEIAVTKSHHYGKHKIKRYLYHFTSEENYQKILESGVLKTSKDGCYRSLDGVFMVDIENFLKRWGRSKDWRYSDLRAELFYHAAKDSNKIVVLRIPTKNLNQRILRIRSQNRLMKSRGKEVNSLCHASKRNLYDQRKEAVEYIYQDSIPINGIEKIGEADFDIFLRRWSSLIFLPKTEQTNFAINICKQLFKNQSEIQAINRIS